MIKLPCTVTAVATDQSRPELIKRKREYQSTCLLAISVSSLLPHLPIMVVKQLLLMEDRDNTGEGRRESCDGCGGECCVPYRNA